MKDYSRFVEPTYLRELAEKYLNHFCNSESKEVALDKLADELEGYLKKRLFEAGITDNSCLSLPLDECLKIELGKDLSAEGGSDKRSYNNGHFLASAATGNVLIDLIRKRKYEEAIITALSFAGKAAEKLRSNVFNDLNCYDLDLLFGDYKEPEDMSPSSDGGICADIIVQARGIWGVDPLTDRDSYPSCKRQSANFIKNAHLHVFQAAGRHTAWKEPKHQTSMVTHEHLDCQIDPERVMYYLKDTVGAHEYLDKDTSQAEVYAANAILYSFSVLEEISDAELRDDQPDTGVVDRYLKEAQGFLRQAYELSEGVRFNRQLTANNSQNAQNDRHDKALQEVTNDLVSDFGEGCDNLITFAVFTLKLRALLSSHAAYDTDVDGCTSLELDGDRLVWTNISKAKPSDSSIKIENLRAFYKRALSQKALQEVTNGLVSEFSEGCDNLITFAVFTLKLRALLFSHAAYDTDVDGCTNLELDGDKLVWTDISKAKPSDGSIKIENLEIYHEKATKELV